MGLANFPATVFIGLKNLTKGTICEKLGIVTRHCLDPGGEIQNTQWVNGRSSVTIFGQGIVTPRIRRKVEKGRNYNLRCNRKKQTEANCHKKKHRHGRKDLDTDGSVSNCTSGQQVY